jgi:hypothetical protein
MPDNVTENKGVSSSVQAINNIGMEAARNFPQPTSVSEAPGAKEQLKAAQEFPQPEARGYIPDIKMKLEGKSQDENDRDYLERLMSYERFVEDAEARINSTTLPWEARMAVRDTEFQFIDAPPGLGDNWGLQRLYNFLDSRERTIHKLIAPDKARSAIGLDEEPWRDTHMINRQDKNQLIARLMDDKKISKNKAEGMADEREDKAKERAPYFCEELKRNRDELALTRKVTFLWWGWRNAASGQEMGDYYRENKIPSLPQPKDFAQLLKTPSYFVSGKENLKPGDVKKANEISGYPTNDQIEEFLISEKGSKENEPLGKLIEKEMRVMYTIALSDNPERLMEWKLNAERGKLNEILIREGVNPAYIILRDKGIYYKNDSEDAKIQSVISGLSSTDRGDIQNAWWKQLGFADAASAKYVIGDPERWVPIKARRGDPDVGATQQVHLFDRTARKDQITGVLLGLQKDWQDLSPLNNHTFTEVAAIRNEINEKTIQLRNLATYNKDKKLLTLIPTLPLENELEYRGTATKLGCVWARVQLAEGKEELFKSVLPDLVGNDKLALEMSEATIGIFGIPAKHGCNVRDYNPLEPKYSDDEWKVDVEAWPYTSEFQNILAMNWFSRYKAEAFGPDGSRNRFGPLMTDYLTANMIRDYDEHGNELFVIFDKGGNLRKGRADEGLVIADTSRTILQEWEKGVSLSEERLWKGVTEDPFRRFLLRSFFAEGKAALGPGGNAFIDILRKKEWDLDRDLNEKFLDDYKLARRVALKPELDKEDIWKDIVAPIDDKYKTDMASCLTKLDKTTDLTARQSIIKEYSSLYAKWIKNRWDEVFDYVDQTWWNGVMSTRSCVEWGIQETEIAKKEVGGSLIANRPSRVLTNFANNAKKRKINLFGKYSISVKDMPSVMTSARKVFEKD